MTDQQDLRARLPELPPNVEEGLHYFFETGDDGDRIYVTAIRQYIAVLRSRITALSQTARVPPELEELSAKATQGELVARVVERDGAFRDAFVTVPSVIQGTSVVGDYPLEWLADDSYNDPADPRQKAHDAQFTAAAINWVRTMLAAAKLGRAGDVDYVPGALDASSPPRVWLQIDTDGDNDIRDERWPGSEHVTWHDEPIGGLEIQYVRADLVSPQLPAGVPMAWLVESGDYRQAFTEKATANAQAFECRKAGYGVTITPLAAAPQPDSEESK